MECLALVAQSAIQSSKPEQVKLSYFKLSYCTDIFQTHEQTFQT